MLEYELKYLDNSRADYSYYVEGDRSRSGLVSLSRDTGESYVVAQAQGDRFNRYAFHLMSRLREFFDEGSFKKAGIVAWH